MDNKHQMPIDWVEGYNACANGKLFNSYKSLMWREGWYARHYRGR
jgi:hypothetical protein